MCILFVQNTSWLNVQHQLASWGVSWVMGHGSSLMLASGVNRESVMQGIVQSAECSLFYNYILKLSFLCFYLRQTGHHLRL